ncbi:MAG: L,D-transpeptidase, partial [Bosea sp. (in: a-proteobacteria)]
MLRISFSRAVLIGAVFIVPSFDVLAQQAQFRPVSQSYGQPQAYQQGSYGGGLIEALMTGGGQRSAAYQTPQGSAASRHGEALYGAPIASRGQPGIDPMTGEPVQRQRMAAVSGQRADYERPISRAIDPRFVKQEVEYDGRHAPGTVVIDTSQRFLFLVQPGGRALRYGIGVGRAGFEWRGTNSVSRKSEWPDWRPPAAMLKRRPDLPRYMEGGPDNPMGARGIYLGATLYRIHGTNEPHSIGTAVSSGCIRMTNDDVTDLYDR